MTEDSEYVEFWRELVAMECRQRPLLFAKGTPVVVDLCFFFQRPGRHISTGRIAKLRPSAPACHVQRPDADKLARAILDALDRANVYHDDSQVVDLRARKEWTSSTPGVRILVTEYKP